VWQGCVVWSAAVFHSHRYYTVHSISKTYTNQNPTFVAEPLRRNKKLVLTALLNEISTVSNNFILVLDDYHVIDAQPVDNALTFLLEHLPQQMHLIIATREDPTLPLARLRVRDQLTEVRATDLRFTPSEAAEFLNQVMGRNPGISRTRQPVHRPTGQRAALVPLSLSLC